MAITASTQKLLKGTILKMAVNFDYPSDPSVTLDTIQWYTEWYTSGRKLTLQKEEHIQDEDGFFAMVDTAKIGTGVLKMRLWAEIPDADAPDGVRIEYGEYTTDITIN